MKTVEIFRDRGTDGQLCTMLICVVDKNCDDDPIVKMRYVDWAPGLSGEVVMVGQDGEQITVAVPEFVTEAKTPQFLYEAEYSILRIG